MQEPKVKFEFTVREMTQSPISGRSRALSAHSKNDFEDYIYNLKLKLLDVDSSVIVPKSHLAQKSSGKNGEKSLGCFIHYNQKYLATIQFLSKIKDSLTIKLEPGDNSQFQLVFKEILTQKGYVGSISIPQGVFLK